MPCGCDGYFPPSRPPKRSMKIRGRTRLDDGPRIESDRTRRVSRLLLPGRCSCCRAESPGGERTPQCVSSLGCRRWLHRRSDPIARRADCLEREAPPATHRRFTSYQAADVSSPGASSHRSARAAASPVVGGAAARSSYTRLRWHRDAFQLLCSAPPVAARRSPLRAGRDRSPRPHARAGCGGEVVVERLRDSRVPVM